MKQRAGITPDGKRCRIRYGMRQTDHLNRKGTNIKHRTGAHLDQRNIEFVAIFCQLAAQQCQRERAAIYRASQFRPHIGDRPEMIFMTMGQNKPGKLVTAGFNEAEIRQQDIDTRHAVIGEGRYIYHPSCARAAAELLRA